MNISCDSLFGNEVKVNNFNRNAFEKLLRMALQNILTVKSINKLME